MAVCRPPFFAFANTDSRHNIAFSPGISVQLMKENIKEMTIVKIKKNTGSRYHHNSINTREDCTEALSILYARVTRDNLCTALNLLQKRPGLIIFEFFLLFLQGHALNIVQNPDYARKTGDKIIKQQNFQKETMVFLMLMPVLFIFLRDSFRVLRKIFPPFA
ncbi:hypothetical protein V8J88_16450 [Massilia sp. W12]|uniref:hypothetical protein n=1 Tax=Massilia sp. W12 TaxID=3126507 RepID=UPI0030CA7453